MVKKRSKPPTRNTLRHHCRALTRSTVRSLPGGRRGPDPMSQALTAFARAIRSHRRLAKLAPSFFDSTGVDREARERDEQRRWMESWQAALDKVYGPTRDANHRASEGQDFPPPLPGPHTRLAVERELATWDLWMTTGRLALARQGPHLSAFHTFLGYGFYAVLDGGVEWRGKFDVEAASDERQPERFARQLGQFHANAAQDAFALSTPQVANRGLDTLRSWG